MGRSRVGGQPAHPRAHRGPPTRRARYDAGCFLIALTALIASARALRAATPPLAGALRTTLPWAPPPDVAHHPFHRLGRYPRVARRRHMARRRGGGRLADAAAAARGVRHQAGQRARLVRAPQDALGLELCHRALRGRGALRRARLLAQEFRVARARLAGGARRLVAPVVAHQPSLRPARRCCGGPLAARAHRSARPERAAAREEAKLRELEQQ